MTKQQPQRERIIKYIEREYDIRAEYLWREYPEYAVFRHPNGGKWFAIIMNVPRRRLGRGDDTVVNIINIHCAPSMLGTVLPETAFMPGYHMNKASWSTIFLDDTLPDRGIYPLIRASFESVTPAIRTRRKKST